MFYFCLKAFFSVVFPDNPDNTDMAKKRSSFDRLKEAAQASLPKSNFRIPGPSLLKPPEAWHIAVRGDIDLRQHHPSWYRLIGCITESELAEGQKSLFTLRMPPIEGGVMQFDVGDFAINVIPDRWMIQTVTKANCDRLIDVATKVFRKLNELSLTAYGVNKSIVIELESSTAEQFLGSRLINANLALPSGKAEACVYFSHHREESDTQIWMHPSPAGDKWLNIEYNRHHPIKANPFTYSDLGMMLTQNAKVDWANADEYEAAFSAITLEI